MKNNNYLERIAIALETLVNQGNSLSAEFEEVIKSSPTPVEETPVENKQLTHDDLKALCLKTARESTGNRDKLKALLSEYNATKAVDVKSADIKTIIDRINAGKF
jgi:hypothetical protein